MSVDFEDFIYDANSFSFVFRGKRKSFKQTDVEKIIGYKIDLYSEDVICLELFFKDFKLLFNEENKGWDEFLNKMHQNFPQINQNWRFDIVKLAFARNETIIFRLVR